MPKLFDEFELQTSPNVNVLIHEKKQDSKLKNKQKQSILERDNDTRCT